MQAHSLKFQWLKILLGSLCVAVAPLAVSAPEDSANQRIENNARSNVIRMEQTVVSGNQELPKVLYIVPWQQAGDLPDITLEPELKELQVFRRLYPPAYRRELKYYQLLKAASTEK